MYFRRGLNKTLLVLIIPILVFTACTSEAGNIDIPLNAEEIVQNEVANLLRNVSTDFMVDGSIILENIDNNPEEYILFDIRRNEDYLRGHIKGAINLPYADFRNKVNVLPKDRTIYLVCYSGQTSGQTTMAATLLGYTVYSFQGGMNFGFSAIEDNEKWLAQSSNPLPEAKELELNKRQQILWDAGTSFFNDRTDFIVAPNHLEALIKDVPDSIIVLDIRSEESFVTGHIKGAINIPFEEIGNNLNKIKTNRAIYVVSYTGQKAGAIVGALRIANYNAMLLRRGILSWRSANLPLIDE